MFRVFYIALVLVLTAWVVFVRVGWVPGWQWTEELERLHRQSRSQSPKPSPPATEHNLLQVHYEWKDANTELTLERRGEARVIDATVPARRLSYTGAIDRQQLQNEIESFGVPDDWMFQLKGAELVQQAYAHGIQVVVGGNQREWSAAYDWMVKQSRTDVQPFTVGLRQLAERNNYRDSRGFFGVVASFVQGLRYQIPDSYRTRVDGARVFTSGVSMPLETLYNGWGDCDTKCVLFASLLTNVVDVDVIFLLGNAHAFVGIRGSPRMYDRYVTVQGSTYVLAELTAPIPLGWIPAQSWMGIQRNEFRIVRIP